MVSAMKKTDMDLSYKVADILGSVTTYNRLGLGDELREIGPERFIEKYRDSSLLPRHKAPDDWPSSPPTKLVYDKSKRTIVSIPVGVKQE